LLSIFPAILSNCIWLNIQFTNTWNFYGSTQQRPAGGVQVLPPIVFSKDKDKKKKKEKVLEVETTQEQEFDTDKGKDKDRKENGEKEKEEQMIISEISNGSEPHPAKKQVWTLVA
jgi:hypothetical protein